MSILGKIFGDANERVVNSLRPIVEEINNLEKDFEKLSDEELKARTADFKNRLQPRRFGRGSDLASEGNEFLDDILPEAFAAVREAAKRTLGQRHFDVQLMGGITLHRGQIAEMKTGEGKTLVATLPAYLNALTGKGVHIVTVNDYLARRDAVWMGQIYDALGLSVGVLNHEASYLYDREFSRRSDVTSEVGTPTSLFHTLDSASGLRPVTRREAYAADITYGTNNEYGFDYLRDNMVYHLDQMVQTRRKTQNETQNNAENNSASVSVRSVSFRDGKIHNFAIVDEVDSILIDEARTPLIISTPDTESAELYKVFAKVVPKLRENEDYNVDEKMRAVTITDSGIEKVEKALGLKDIYTEQGMRYVHHLEQALRAQTLFVRDRDYVVRTGEVIIVDEFTGRLMPGRRWSDGLHQAVEAKEGVRVEHESRTLATITFQNYFRMYQKLAGMTGTAQTSAEEFHKVYNLEVVQIPTNKQMVRKDLPDKVFQSENGKFNALVREIKSRHSAGQPVLVGTVSISKNETLSARLQREGVTHKVLNAKNHEEEGSIIAQAGRFAAVTVATNMAGRGVDIILGGNPAEPEEAGRVRGVGGLLVIGTERHEARRIDDQLRGRSGRQGDPGETQFFVSLEDDLMRIFGGERVKNLMGKFGIPEDEPIENKMVSNAIESAQGKIEGFNFDARKHVLEYDDVMNKQRISIYNRRRRILVAGSNEIEEEAQHLIDGVAEKIISAHTMGHPDEWNRKEIFENLVSLGGPSTSLRASGKEGSNPPPNPLPARPAGGPYSKGGGEGEGFSSSVLTDKINFAGTHEELLDISNNYLRASFLAKKEAVEARLPDGQGFEETLRIIMLQAIDALWMEHLEAMEYMRSSVRLRAYAQKDPLVEYKNEGARMFKELESHINAYIANLIFRIAPSSQPRREVGTPTSFSVNKNSASGQPAIGGQPGRNDPCPCGSGKKYKKCHGS